MLIGTLKWTALLVVAERDIHMTISKKFQEMIMEKVEEFYRSTSKKFITRNKFWLQRESMWMMAYWTKKIWCKKRNFSIKSWIHTSDTFFQWFFKQFYGKSNDNFASKAASVLHIFIMRNIYDKLNLFLREIVINYPKLDVVWKDFWYIINATAKNIPWIPRKHPIGII